jgi:hypothetical protein
MAKKLGAPIALGVVTIFAILLLTNGGNQNEEVLKNTFYVDAIYVENSESSNSNYVQITFEDKSQKTNAVVLEVLGMEESFQKTYLESEFAETIMFPTPPKYGWEIHPVTLLIDHEDLGKVSIKTEIRPEGETSAPIIYGNP